MEKEKILKKIQTLHKEIEEIRKMMTPFKDEFEPEIKKIEQELIILKNSI
jgi:hypothetical protein